MRLPLLTMLLMLAACGGSTNESLVHSDGIDDCRASFSPGPVACGPGADITSVAVDPAGPIVLTIDLLDPPHYDIAFQWLVEFSISDLACGLTNSEATDSGFVGSEVLGPYGYRLVTNEDAPAGTCEGSLDGTTARLVFNIQPPQGPWVIIGGTQQVELDNVDDPGSSDDVAIDVAVE